MGFAVRMSKIPFMHCVVIEELEFSHFVRICFQKLLLEFFYVRNILLPE